jgi:hypothetical protein
MTNGLYMTTVGTSEMDIIQAPLTVQMVRDPNCGMMDLQNIVYTRSIGRILMQDIK